jgi:hypothetical protein
MKKLCVMYQADQETATNTFIQRHMYNDVEAFYFHNFSLERFVLRGSEGRALLLVQARASMLWR